MEVYFLDKFDDGGCYVGPMVYFGTYPISLHQWNQILETYKNRIDDNLNESKEKLNYFMLPFPEDEE